MEITEKPQGWTAMLEDMSVNKPNNFPGYSHSTIRAIISGRLKKKHKDRVYETELKTVPVPGQSITVQVLTVTRTK